MMGAGSLGIDSSSLRPIRARVRPRQRERESREMDDDGELESFQSSRHRWDRRQGWSLLPSLVHPCDRTYFVSPGA